MATKSAKKGPTAVYSTALIVCRTDASQVVTYTPSEGPTLTYRNEPDPQRRSNLPDASGSIDYYWKIDDSSYGPLQAWKGELGRLYCEAIPVPEDVKREIVPLGDFPQGYTLWGHFSKIKEPDGNFKERLNHYLYGHPSGNEYRSIAEFYPHLRWLAFDVAGDPSACTCLYCNSNYDPDGRRSRAFKMVAATNGVLTQNALSNAVFHAKEPSKEQNADTNTSSTYIYRPGEIVWVDRNGNQTIWRLAVIVDRQKQDGVSFYALQPLSNPRSPQPRLISSEQALRPWLAWSVPDTGIPELDTKSFDDVNWNAILDNPQYSGTDHVVTGSIVAAKQVDASFSLFTKIDTPAGMADNYYSGMFLGAEKVWVGDAVRIRNSTSGARMTVVSALIENISPDGKSQVTVVGNTYQTTEVLSATPRTSDLDGIPQRIRDDLDYRNQIVANLRNVRYEWRLIERNSRLKLEDIQGRWYETKLLLPILKPAQQVQQDQRHGLAQDVCEFLNGRMHKNKNADTRRKNRKDALKTSVPESCKISQGLDKPLEPFMIPPGAAVSPQEDIRP